MFTTLIVQPIFNVLTLIYALLPGHNFGLALIIFTIITRLLMWPLVKKQLHHAKAMRELAPELNRIKKEAKGDRQKQQVMTMALYKEKAINPFASFGLLLVQLPILIGLYSGINRIVNDPNSLVDLSYSFIQGLGSIQALATDISQFDATLFGVVDLTKAALSDGGIYWPAMIIVIASAVSQYFQTKQLMPTTEEDRKLKDIFKDASKGKQADQSEVNAAVGRSTRFFLPALIFLFTVNLPSALSLYWLTTGIVAIIQQDRVLKQDKDELTAVANKKEPSVKVRVSKAKEAEIVKQPSKNKKKKRKSKKGGRR